MTQQEAEQRSVAQLPDGLTHIEDSNEVRNILEDIGYDDKEVFRSLFVSTQDGEYEQIWGCRYKVPFLHYTCWRIHG